MKNLYKYLSTIIIALLITQYTIAGTGAYVTLVNGTAYEWHAVKHSTFQMNAWNYPKTLKAGKSKRIYLEYKESYNRSAMVKYEIAPNHFITIEFDGGYNEHRIYVSSNFLINGFDTSQVHYVNTIHDGMIHFILVGSEEDGYYTNFAEYSKNWMQNSLKIIGNRKLEQICIPGSHDAGMYVLNHRTDGASKCNTLTQDHAIYKQLKYGIRYFDIRPVIGGADCFYAGHYSYTKKYNIHWQGADGGKISDMVSDINKFTAIHKELIILELSHDLNTNDGYRGLNSNEWNRLFDLLSGIHHLYIATSSKRLKDLTLNDFIKKESQVIILVDPSKLPTSSKYYRKGFYHTHEFSIYNQYSGTHLLSKMSKDQFSKMDKYSASRYFLLSWTLTQDKNEIAGCEIDAAKSIKALARIAKQSLPEEVINKSSLIHYPNILYTDLITDNNSAILSMAINYRNNIDLNYTNAKKIAPDHMFANTKIDIENNEILNFSRKEMFFNYGIENFLIKVEYLNSRIAIYHKFDYKNNKLNLFSEFPVNKEAIINILFTTNYNSNLVIGWYDYDDYILEMKGAKVFPFHISSLDLSIPNAVWVSKSYSNKEMINIKGAFTLNENNTQKLCFVTNKKMIKYDFTPNTCEINNPIVVNYDLNYLTHCNKLTQVLPYMNNGETEVLFIGKEAFPTYSFVAYQYYPLSNKFHQVFYFIGKENVVFVESRISKIYNMPENTKNQYITKRFQAFALDYKKVPTTNYKISYIYTFGIAPNDSLMTYLSTYTPTPPSFSYFLTEYNANKALFASRNYTVKNNDTITQTWFWYPKQLNITTQENYICAMIFDDDNSKSPARFATRKTVGTINWKIYPNPIADNKYVTVEYETKRSSDIEIKLYNIQGTLISSKSIKNNDIGKYIYQFDTENLSKGTYYITIRVNNDFESKLLLMQ